MTLFLMVKTIDYIMQQRCPKLARWEYALDPLQTNTEIC